MNRAAAARPPRARATNDLESPWNDVIGILLLMLACMYLLAMLSYDPRDMPGWSHLSLSDEPGLVTQNFMGNIGAFLAGYSLFFMGIAAYVIPICITWFGVCKLHSKLKLTRIGWLGVFVLVISAAALLQVLDFVEQNKEITPSSGGGVIGKFIGNFLFMSLIGKVGSVLVLGVIYFIGLFMVTGMHPVTVVQSIRREFSKWKEESEQRRLIEERLAEEEASIVPGTLTPVPVELRKKKKGAAGEAAMPMSITPELGLKFDSPPPKIIDSSGPRVHDDNSDKPKLTEVWEKKRAQKIEQAPHGSLGNLTVRFKDYKLPPMDLLKWPEDENRAPTDKGELLAVQSTIVKALASFGITVEPGDITRGPAITRYEVRPVDGLRVSRIANLDADIARATRAERINILAPIPGKDTVGIELANKEKTIVPLRELLEDDIFINGKAKLPVALGKDVYGKTIIGDLAAMPHLLVAGATGSGKSVCINAIVTSLLCRFAPDELRFIMIDPKVVEMQNYEELPHLALPVVTDPKKALLALRWVVKEMENRYQIFAQEGCRNFEAFNNRNRKRKADADAARAVLATTVEASKPTAKAASKAVSKADPMAADPTVGMSFVHAVSINTIEADESIPEDLSDLRDDSGTWLGDSQPPPTTTERDHRPATPDTLPYIVVIVDELADLMQTAPADIEVCIARIQQSGNSDKRFRVRHYRAKIIGVFHINPDPAIIGKV